MPRKESPEVTWPEHPLFPAEDGDDPPPVSFIQISRYEANGSVLIPRTFAAAELTSEAQIGEMFGGGLYELIGRRSSKLDPASMGNITRKRRIRLPGASTPLAPEAPAAAPPEAPVPAHAPAMGMSDNIIVAMMQMQSQAATAQAQAQAVAQQQFAQMMMTMITSSKSDQQGMMQAMMQMSTQQTQSMATMMTALLSSRGGGPDELAKYAELFKTLTGKPPAGEPEEGMNVGKLLEDGADLVQGLVELKKNAGGTGGAGGAAPPAEMG